MSSLDGFSKVPGAVLGILWIFRTKNTETRNREREGRKGKTYDCDS